MNSKFTFDDLSSVPITHKAAGSINRIDAEIARIERLQAEIAGQASAVSGKYAQWLSQLRKRRAALTKKFHEHT